MGRSAKDEAKVRFVAETHEFNEGIKSSKTAMAGLRAEVRLAQAAFQNTGNATQMLTQKQTALKAQLRENRSQQEMVNSKLKAAVSCFGENSDEAQKLRNQITGLKVGEQQLETQLTNVTNELAKQQAKERMAASGTEQLNSAITKEKTKLSELKVAYQNAYLAGGKNSAEAKRLGAEIRATSSSLERHSRSLNASAVAANRFDRSAKTSGGALSSMKGQLKGMAAGVAAAFSVNAVVNFSKACIESYKTAEQTNTKLATIMKQRMGANTKEIKSVQDLATAQSKQGVVSAGATKAGAQQLATFLKQSSSLKTLIPAMNDLAAQQKGVNASGKDLTNIGNLMGKVFTGQTGALRRCGISFSEAQEKVLKYGTEQEKAAMLSKVVTENVGHMNSALAKTDAGKIQQAQNKLNALKSQIGKDLIPIKADLAMVGGMLVSGIATALPYVESGLGKVKGLILTIIGPVGAAKKELAGVWTYAKEAFAPIAKELEPLKKALAPVIAQIKKFTGQTKAAGNQGKIFKGICIALKGAIRVVAAAIRFALIPLKIMITIVKKVTAAIRTLNAAGRKVKSAFSGVRQAMVHPFTSAWSAIRGIPGKIRNAFRGIKPRIGLSWPHISVSGGKAPWGIGGKGTKPSFHVTWNAAGAVFKRPTIFQTPLGLQGVGDSRSPEAVAPVDVLQGYVRSAIMDVVRMFRIDYDKFAQICMKAAKNQPIYITVDGRVFGRLVREVK
ncbi:hypothetical protein [Hornefia butyriciproducens]|uniref:hypothetical protein n=1 Tax=Hornefia butyriciproducens TaxID=2652293 RepID=UPI003F889CEA